jgi:sialic acid synthase SpsE/quercetin dioxygenase-like cupin family protein
MNSEDLFKRLFVFEMANNHMGDVNHGLKIIREYHMLCKDFDGFKFAFKFQYRNLETFIHPDYNNRTDIKYVKRFIETNLSETERISLKDEAKRLGFITICTPFDESSVDLIIKHDYDVIKVASCSFTDWPLLEKIVKTDKPIIASTAGVFIEDIDKAVSFFEHRNKDFCLMHCVGEYPTDKKNLQLNQIDLLKQRYPDVPIGYSTHESIDNYDAIKIAIAKGASIFERHVAVRSRRYNINAYSSLPENISAWLHSAKETYEMSGISGERHSGTDKEKADLRGLQRGVFAVKRIQKGEKIDVSNVYFAIPNLENQIIANQMSKYEEFVANKDIGANQPILMTDVVQTNLRGKVLEIVNNVKALLIESSLALPNRVEIEISHHYGLEKFQEWGAVIINCINREYCKKLIILLPEQKHPVHFHRKKEETFYMLYGDMHVNLNGRERVCKAGDMTVVERGAKHSFSSEHGAIFEEISTTHYKNDSYYEDESVLNNKNRKTSITFWSDWLSKTIV